METSTPVPAPPVVRATAVAGQLTFGWRVATVATWVLVFIAWSGVWKASRELGIATWWLGPAGEPRPIPVMLVPFVAPGVMVALAVNGNRRIPFYGLGAAVISAVIGIVDLSYIRRLGYVELLLAGAGAAVSVASLSGMYRTVAAAPAPPVPVAHGVPDAPAE